MALHYKHLVSLTIGASILALGACGFDKPNAIPSGYTYHHNTYKSPIPPATDKITIEQRKYMDAAQAEQFRDAVYDLLERLTMRAGMPPKPVYVMAPDPMTTFYANIDNDLRESMRHIGYAISDQPEGAYVFTYDAQPAVTQGPENVQLTLRVFDSLSLQSRQLTEEMGQYYIQGAEEINLTPAKYHVLPSVGQRAVHPLQGKQAQMVRFDERSEGVQMESSIQPVEAMPIEMPAPDYVPEPVPQVMQTPMAKQPRAPIMDQAPAPRSPVSPPVSMQAPTIEKPMVATPKRKVSKPSMKSTKDDIIVINRNDKAGVSVPNNTAAMPPSSSAPSPKVMTPQMATPPSMPPPELSSTVKVPPMAETVPTTAGKSKADAMREAIERANALANQ